MTQLTTRHNGALPLTSSTMSSGGSEAIKVIVRCRPLSEQEINAGHQKVVFVDSKRGLIEVKDPKEPQNPPKSFTFDAVYDENSKQMDLYYEIFRELVDSVLNGFNGTIFAYGQTGTGKTFTMEGIRDNPELRGVIPNAIEHIFRHISQSTNQQYLVRASYLEIYQEEIRDLLNTKEKDKKLELKERPDTGVYIQPLNSFVTKSVDEIMQVMKIGNENRSVGKTNMNEHSSRSHAIFMITIECSELGPDGENHIRVGRLNLVDLAGSERQSKTGAQGERFKEATKINLSLSALGNVISALVDGKSSHIPYRDSKLTRILQDSLGGNSKTVMVANIGPASYNLEETLSCLRYANRAKNIKNKPRINEDPKDALLREFQDEIARLKEMLKKRGTSGNRKKRRRQEGISETPEPADETTAEEYLREQQRKLDDERAALEQNASLREEEKLRLLENLEDRQRQLAHEREAQKLVTEKILNMQSKLLSGTGNLLDQAKEQQRLLQEKRIELAEQKRREREILQQLEAQEDNTAEIHQTFANLQQEVEVKTKKLQKLFAKLQQVRMEIQDNADVYSKERQQLEQSIAELNKELKLKWLIVENFIPVVVVDKLRDRAIFDEDQGVWRVLKPGERPGSGEYITLEKTDQKIMVDSGLGPGISDVSSSCEEGFKLMPIKRPVSMIGLRRPTTRFEREAMMHLKQRMRSPETQISSSKDSASSGNQTDENVFVSDNVLRFCGENVISFGGLEIYSSKVNDYQPDAASGSRASTAAAKESNRKASQNVVIEVTKIPSPRSASSTRAGSNIRRLSTASVSKNVRARSAHGRAIATPLSPAGSQGSASSADRSTPTLVFPKARGLVTDANSRRR
uniref:Kinesin-like protein n=1 Tax=Panagrolaimus sp. JU765 TaxID=591449 RepID=A0AC34RIY5_9BILA